MSENNQHTVLVVDDVEDNRDIISRRLRRAGYEVFTASDGGAALRYLLPDIGASTPAIDLVVLDIMMPGLTGIDVLKQVRKTRSTTELPIIMATAKDHSDNVVEALEAGANDYVTKPIDFPVIMARIHTQLKMKTSATPAPDPAPQHDPDDGDFVGLLGAIRPGMVLGGKYKLEAELGAGNFGAVYRASHLGFQHPVAVKILQTSVEDSPKALARFQQEGRSAFKLKHRNAVSVMDFSVTPAGLAYLVMEVLEGQTLEAELRQRGHLSELRAAEIILPICEVLHEAHALGIIHRDIKPANIFLHRARREEIVKVLDFGIAKLIGDGAMNQNLTLDEGILGTPAYMAPERLWGKHYDGRADAYGVGIMLYQMLAGRPPFVAEHNEAMAIAMMHVTNEPEPLRQFRPDVSPGLEEAVMSMLEKDQAKRPTVARLAAQLAEVLSLDLPAALRPELVEAETFDTELAFAFNELLAPPTDQDPTDQDPTQTIEPIPSPTGGLETVDGSPATGSPAEHGSLALYPPDGVTGLWTRR